MVSAPMPLPAFGPNGLVNGNQSANCARAAIYADAFGRSARRSARVMERAAAWWRETGGREEIAAVYDQQKDAYEAIAEHYDGLGARARGLAAVLSEAGREQGDGR